MCLAPPLLTTPQIDWRHCRCLILDAAAPGRAKATGSARSGDTQEVAEEAEEAEEDSDEEDVADVCIDAPQPVPRSVFDVSAPVFAARQSASPRPPGYRPTMTIEDEVGNVFEISKTRACAIISNHPRCSKDRLTRVRGPK